MIADIHTHLVHYETDLSKKLKADIRRCMKSDASWRYSYEDYVRDTAAADKVFVFGIRAKATGWFADNEKIAEFAHKNPGRYIFVASVDPMEEDFMDQLAYCHQTLHAKMIKLGPVYQGLHPLDPKYCEIYGYCQRHGLPIITHMATTFANGAPLEYARPIHMDQVACDFPRLKIVLAHMGHPWEGETIAIIRNHPHVYADISALYYRPWQFYNTMRLLEEYGTQEKVFFGSDYPATTTEDSLIGVRKVNDLTVGTSLPRVSDEVIEEIIYRNPLEVLEIN